MIQRNKIKYRFNPYTYARICAMKSLLLKKDDYDKIKKMSPNEIIKFMQEGVYAPEINKLVLNYSGINLVENALNKHLEKIFLKLKLISDPSIEYLIIQYLKRYDFWNLKTILRAKLSNVDEEEALSMLLPVGTLKKEKLKQLFSYNTAREILANSNLIAKDVFREAIHKYETSKNLGEIENLLDYHYYLNSIVFSKRIPKEGKLFREFFRYEVDIYNIKLILKKIILGLNKKDIEKYIIYKGRDLRKRDLKNMLNCKNLNSLFKELSFTSYQKILPEIKEETDPVLRFEILLERFLLERSLSLFHQNPLTVDTVLGFMFAKEIEVKNLRVIIKSKTLEYTEDYVKNLIVIGR